jgi:hypothetical protein
MAPYYALATMKSSTLTFGRNDRPRGIALTAPVH